jgi:hypothetical protein
MNRNIKIKFKNHNFRVHKLTKRKKIKNRKRKSKKDKLTPKIYSNSKTKSERICQITGRNTGGTSWSIKEKSYHNGNEQINSQISIVYFSDWYDSGLDISLDDTVDSGVAYTTSTPKINKRGLVLSTNNTETNDTFFTYEMEDEIPTFQTIEVVIKDFVVEYDAHDSNGDEDIGERPSKRRKTEEKDTVHLANESSENTESEGHSPHTTKAKSRFKFINDNKSQRLNIAKNQNDNSVIDISAQTNGKRNKRKFLLKKREINDVHTQANSICKEMVEHSATNNKFANSDACNNIITKEKSKMHGNNSESEDSDIEVFNVNKYRHEKTKSKKNVIVISSSDEEKDREKITKNKLMFENERYDEIINEELKKSLECMEGEEKERAKVQNFLKSDNNLRNTSGLTGSILKLL